MWEKNLFNSQSIIDIKCNAVSIMRFIMVDSLLYTGKHLDSGARDKAVIYGLAAVLQATTLMA
jgi:hypothetical protein